MEIQTPQFDHNSMFWFLLVFVLAVYFWPSEQPKPLKEEFSSCAAGDIYILDTEGNMVCADVKDIPHD